MREAVGGTRCSGGEAGQGLGCLCAFNSLFACDAAEEAKFQMNHSS